MSYITPAFDFGMAKLSVILSRNGFIGAIIPDCPVGCPEFDLFQKSSDQILIPVISPLTTVDRLIFIRSQMKANQMIYATARSGLTGVKTDLNHPGFLGYADFLKCQLPNNPIALGFGIRTRDQVRQVQSLDLIPVVATELISRIDLAWQTPRQQKNSSAEVVYNWCREVMISV